MCSAHGYPGLASQILSGEILAVHFCLLARRLPTVAARGMVQAMRATMIGAMVAWHGSAAEPMADRLIAEAYPRGG